MDRLDFTHRGLWRRIVSGQRHCPGISSMHHLPGGRIDNRLPVIHNGTLSVPRRPDRQRYCTIAGTGCFSAKRRKYPGLQRVSITGRGSPTGTGPTDATEWPLLTVLIQRG